jgi:uroporphyrinogen-III synthase
MRLLVTRPAADAESFARILEGQGHQAVVAPIMEVRALAGPAVALDGVQAVIATSANGVRALAQRTPRRDVTLYAVGPQTAEAAAASGFKTVYNAAGDAAALVEFVAAHTKPDGGKLLHAAGEETAGRLRQALTAQGFTVETAVLYGAHPVAELPPPAAQALSEGVLDGVLLFSPRSAKTFATLVIAAQLQAACAKLTAFCISAATAAALSPLTFARVAVAGTPNQDAILSLLTPPEAAGA